MGRLQAVGPTANAAKSRADPIVTVDGAAALAGCRT
jgi:hypothetical protein